MNKMNTIIIKIVCLLCFLCLIDSCKDSEQKKTIRNKITITQKLPLNFKPDKDNNQNLTKNISAPVPGKKPDNKSAENQPASDIQNISNNKQPGKTLSNQTQNKLQQDNKSTENQPASDIQNISDNKQPDKTLSNQTQNKLQQDNKSAENQPPYDIQNISNNKQPGKTLSNQTQNKLQQDNKSAENQPPYDIQNISDNKQPGKTLSNQTQNKLQQDNKSAENQPPYDIQNISDNKQPDKTLSASTINSDNERLNDNTLISSLSLNEMNLRSLEGSTSLYNPKDKIDPFDPLFKNEPAPAMSVTKKSISNAKLRIPLTPIEMVDISQLRLTGIINTIYGGKALVADASGKGYIINKGDYIGSNSGQATKISLIEQKMIVEEPILPVDEVKKNSIFDLSGNNMTIFVVDGRNISIFEMNGTKYVDIDGKKFVAKSRSFGGKKYYVEPREMIMQKATGEK